MQGDIADEEFSQYFSQFGEIEDCVVSVILCSSFWLQLGSTELLIMSSG